MSHIMKKFGRRSFLFTAATLGTVILVYAWGMTGHYFINLKAAANLPASMGWFKADSAFFQAHASDPDIRRDNSDTTFHSEQYRHYIDIDAYPNFHTLPHNLDSCIMLYGYQTVKTTGLNPWATVWVLDSLTAQLARGDTNDAKQTAADLGHYVADGHQPLHAAANYDGQYTGNGGIHSRYETSMINDFESLLAVYPDSIHYVSSPIDYVFNYLYHTNSLVDSVLAGDNHAKTVSGWSGTGTVPAAYHTAYYNALWSYTQHFTLDQFQRATIAIASLWYTAWVNAGISNFAVLPGSMNFGGVHVGQNKRDSLTVTNIGSTALTISSITSNDPVFSVSPSSGTVPAGSSGKFYVTFTPVDGNPRVDTLTFVHNAPGSPGKFVVQGTGVLSASFGSQPISLNFGSVPVSQNRKDSLTVSNSGFDTLRITSITSNDPVFVVSSASDVLPPGGSHKLYVTFTPVDDNPRIDTITFASNAATSPNKVVVSGSALLSAVHVSIAARWNLISNPVRTSHDSVQQLYPAALSPFAYAFRPDSGYVTRSRLTNGAGYWAKFTTSQTATVTGLLLPSDSVDVSAGWNLIGSASDTVATASITSVNTLIQSPFYGYQNGYQSSNIIDVGKGYWVKVSVPGKLVLTSGATVLRATPAMDVSSFNTLDIADAEGNHRSLFFGMTGGKTINSGAFELPPVPPMGMFDVRFASQLTLEAVADGKEEEMPVLISSPVYPVTVRWNLKQPAGSSKLIIGGKEIPLGENGGTEIAGANSSVVLRVANSTPDATPRAFALGQNYPNPFNPSTEIRYALPNDARVSLQVYDVLGQLVGTLVEGIQQTGFHSAEWSATGFPSGVYFYKLQAMATGSIRVGTFVQVRKMLLVR
jgi:hypothetical protein